MRHKFLFPTIVCALTMMACGQKSDNSYTVSGHIEGLQDGNIIEIIPFSHNPEKAVATDTIKNGTFEFTGEVPEPRIMTIVVKDTYGGHNFMLENSKITISGKAEFAEDFNRYEFKDMQITGSPLSDSLYAKTAFREKLNEQYNEFHERYDNAMNQAKEAQVKNDMATAERLKKEAQEQMAKDENEFFHNVEQQITQNILSNKNTFWGPLLMLYHMNYFGEEQKKWYESFPENVKNSYYGKLVKEELYPVGSLGQKVPEFTVVNKDGKEVKLNELIQGKQYILIDFWASWCAPCRKEIPNLKKQYELYKDKGFEIISISIDKDSKAWEKALQEENLAWPNFRDIKENISALYKVKAVPTMYLIDQNGIMIAENTRGEELAKKLTTLFK